MVLLKAARQIGAYMNYRQNRTSQEWWNETRDNPERFTLWLRKQYHGEITAAERMLTFRDSFIPPDSKWYQVVSTIAEQERTHAAWVAELLVARGINPEKMPDKPERYWNTVLEGVNTYEGLAAAAAHAEQMRLERIRVIADDPIAPADVKAVFLRILPQEEFHAKAFSRMAGSVAMKEAIEKHEAGMAKINVGMESDVDDGQLLPGYAV